MYCTFCTYIAFLILFGFAYLVQYIHTAAAVTMATNKTDTNDATKGIVISLLSSVLLPFSSSATKQKQFDN